MKWKKSWNGDSRIKANTGQRKLEIINLTDLDTSLFKENVEAWFSNWKKDLWLENEIKIIMELNVSLQLIFFVL